MAEQTVTLQPGESKVIAFEVVPSVAKTFQVSVDGLSGSFEAVWSPALSYVSFGHVDVAINAYIPGNIWVDGTRYAAPTTLELVQGSHEFNAEVPSGYRFLTWKVYDAMTKEVIKLEAEPHCWLVVDRPLMVMRADVEPI